MSEVNEFITQYKEDLKAQEELNTKLTESKATLSAELDALKAEMAELKESLKEKPEEKPKEVEKVEPETKSESAESGDAPESKDEEEETPASNKESTNTSGVTGSQEPVAQQESSLAGHANLPEGSLSESASLDDLAKEFAESFNK